MPAVGVGIQVEEEVICLSGILRRRVMIEEGRASVAAGVGGEVVNGWMNRATERQGELSNTFRAMAATPELVVKW